MTSSRPSPHSLGTILRGGIALLFAGHLPLLGQSAGQPPSNYKGPTLYGVCVYIVADTSYYSNIFSTSGYFKFKAQEAFRTYATGQAKGSSLKGSACRWSTSQEEVSTQKEADKRLLGLAGRSAKGVETGWTFDASATALAAPTPATTAPAPTSATMASKPRTPVTTTPTATPAVANGVPSSSTSTVTTAGPSTTGTAAAPGTATTKQTVQDSVASSKSAATASVNDAVATTMGTVTAGATNAMKNIFNRKTKTATGDQQNSAANPAASPSATGQKPAPLGLESTESPQAATAEAQHIEGLVADVAGNEIIVNVGVQAGVQAGTKLAVMHAVRTVKDPATGKVLRTVEDKVGELTIKNADATSAAGIFAGAKPAQVGDIVRSINP